MLDVFQRFAGDEDAVCQLVDGLAHQHGIGAVFGDVGAAAHGKAYVCQRKGGRVVDAVAHHRHAAPLCFELGDEVGFAARRLVAVGVWAVYAERVGDVRHGGGIIAAEDVHADAVRVQAGDGFGAVGFERVGKGKRACGFAVDGYGDKAGDLPDVVFRLPIFRLPLLPNRLHV